MHDTSHPSTARVTATFTGPLSNVSTQGTFCMGDVVLRQGTLSLPAEGTLVSVYARFEQRTWVGLNLEILGAHPGSTGHQDKSCTPASAPQAAPVVSTAPSYQPAAPADAPAPRAFGFGRNANKPAEPVRQRPKPEPRNTSFAMPVRPVVAAPPPPAPAPKPIAAPKAPTVVRKGAFGKTLAPSSFPADARSADPKPTTGRVPTFAGRPMTSRKAFSKGPGLTADSQEQASIEFNAPRRGTLNGENRDEVLGAWRLDHIDIYQDIPW